MGTRPVNVSTRSTGTPLELSSLDEADQNNKPADKAQDYGHYIITTLLIRCGVTCFVHQGRLHFDHFTFSHLFITSSLHLTSLAAAVFYILCFIDSSCISS